jgi:hypothetical protein
MAPEPAVGYALEKASDEDETAPANPAVDSG